MSFQNDIQSKDTVLFPIVRIPSVNTYVSTQSFSIEDVEGDGNSRYYSPLLLSSPNINESIDLESRKYKISNVSLNISNVEYSGARFTDSGLPLNTKVEIWWVSPSCKSVEDCYLIYIGTIRSITHDEKKCRITLEDISQSTMHGNVPVNVLSGENVLDKYKNKPYPMVYGYIDKSPCVVGEKIEADTDIFMDNDNQSVAALYPNNPLYAYNDAYIQLKKIVGTSAAENLGTLGGTQYEVSGNVVTLKSEFGDSGTSNEDASDEAIPSNTIAKNQIIGIETVRASGGINPIQAETSLEGAGHYATASTVETGEGLLGRVDGSVLKEIELDNWDGTSFILGGDGSDIWWGEGLPADQQPGFAGEWWEGGYEATVMGCTISMPIIGSSSYIEHYGIIRPHWKVFYYNRQQWWINPTEVKIRFGGNAPNDGQNFYAETGATGFTEGVLIEQDYFSGSGVSIAIQNPTELLWWMAISHNYSGFHGRVEFYEILMDHYMLLDELLTLDFYIAGVRGREI